MADNPISTTGQVASSTGNIYTPSGTNSATVLLVNLFDTTGGNTVKIYVKENGGTARQIAQFIMTANQAAECVGPFTLSNGDAIQADATNAAQVNFSVSAYEHP